MARMILGVFTHRGNAESAIDNLQSAGYDPKDVSVMMRDTAEAHDVASSTGANVAGSAATGAATGGVVGGLAGLLIGIGAIAIPGVGALLIGGPIAAALGLTGAAATTVSGAVTGALAGGIVGALVGLGIPEEDARMYEEHLKQGAILVAVYAYEEEEDEISDILTAHGAANLRTISVNDSYTPAQRTRVRVRDDRGYVDERYQAGYAGYKGGEVVEDEEVVPTRDESVVHKVKRKLTRKP